MGVRPKHRIVDVKKLKAELATAPPQEVEEITTREAVALLAPEIVTMQSNGYSFETIAERLTSGGVPIRASTLKNYLAEVAGAAANPKDESPRHSRKKAGVRERRKTLRPSPGGGASAASSVKPEAASSASMARSSLASPSRVSPSTSPQERRSTFIPRKDSEEI